MKKLILFTTLGFPSSGKTYFARRFAKQFGIVHLNSDKVRAELFKKPKYTFAENEKLFAEMDRRVEVLLSQGKSIIYDANHIKKVFSKKYQAMAKKYGARYLLLWFQVPIDVAIDRTTRRKPRFDKFVVIKMSKATEPPTKSEPHIIIDGKKPYKEQVDKIKRVLRYN